MIEAVNSVISSAPVARIANDQVSSLRSFAADSAAIESVARAPLAPYISPYISVDVNFDAAVLQLRDADTGDVINQFPSEQTLQARQRQEIQTLNADLVGSSSSRTQSSSVPASVPLGITVVQEVAVNPQPAAKAGAGEAQAAVVALSTGAQSGQVNSTVSVTA